MQRALARLQAFAHWSDNAVRIPGTPFRVGLQPIIGLFPVVGDLIGFALTTYVIQQAWVLKAPRALVWRMAGNALFDLLIGLVPVLGDLADAVFKANARNVKLLEIHLQSRLSPPPPRRRPWLGWLVWAATISALCVGIWMLLQGLFGVH